MQGAIYRYRGHPWEVALPDGGSALVLSLAEQGLLVAELEDKNAELEHLARVVSHDLKSPLLTIRGLLGFVEQDALAGDMDRVRSGVQRVNSAAAQMQELLDELQSLAEVGEHVLTFGVRVRVKPFVCRAVHP